VTSCGVGACSTNAGLLECIGGTEVDSCDPFGGAAPDDPTCDGIDDDCDGVFDEDGPAAGDVGNEVRFSDPTVMTWVALPDATEYNVYRGSIIPGVAFVYDHTCFELQSPDTQTEDTSDPPVDQAFYYLVTATNSCQGEDTLGPDSAGIPRPNGAPCP
jgi:hypothetical protein